MVSKPTILGNDNLKQISTTHQEMMRMIDELKELVMQNVSTANSSSTQCVLPDQRRPPPAPPHQPPELHSSCTSELSSPSVVLQPNAIDFSAPHMFDKSSLRHTFATPTCFYDQSRFDYHNQIPLPNYNQQPWSMSHNSNHTPPLYLAHPQYTYSQPQPHLLHTPQQYAQDYQYQMHHQMQPQPMLQTQPEGHSHLLPSHFNNAQSQQPAFYIAPECDPLIQHRQIPQAFAQQNSLQIHPISGYFSPTVQFSKQPLYMQPLNAAINYPMTSAKTQNPTPFSNSTTFLPNALSATHIHHARESETPYSPFAVSQSVPSDFQQEIGGNNTFHQSLTATLPQNKSSISVDNLPPQSDVVPSSYSASGKLSIIPTTMSFVYDSQEGPQLQPDLLTMFSDKINQQTHYELEEVEADEDNLVGNYDQNHACQNEEVKDIVGSLSSQTAKINRLSILEDHGVAQKMMSRLHFYHGDKSSSSSSLGDGPQPQTPIANINSSEYLVSEILSRLPVKTLLRFRCVSKPWCSIIDSPRFVKARLKRSIESSTNAGLVIGDIFLWNPTTKKYRKLPAAPADFHCSFGFGRSFFCGFGYDAANDDYKVMRIQHDDLLSDGPAILPIDIGAESHMEIPMPKILDRITVHELVAVIVYGLDKKSASFDEENVLVFDPGGGTFDAFFFIIVATNTAAEVALRLVKSEKKNKDVSETIKKMMTAYDCNIVEGVLNNHFKQCV